jgi:hypothetical protein
MANETILRPGEIKDILLREIQAADLHELDVEEVGTILEVKDGIARIYGLGKAMFAAPAACSKSRSATSWSAVSWIRSDARSTTRVRSTPSTPAKSNQRRPESSSVNR